MDRKNKMGVLYSIFSKVLVFHKANKTEITEKENPDNKKLQVNHHEQQEN